MRTIAVSIETSRAYGRAMMEGIAEFAQKRGDWKLRSVADGALTAHRLQGFDGVILRLGSRKTANAIVRAGLPAVDVYGFRDAVRSQKDGSIAVADSNHEAIGRIAAEFFSSRGFKDVAFCGIDGLHFSDRRGRAFLRTAKDLGVRTHQYTRPRQTLANASLFFAERLDQTPDAESLRAWLLALPKPIAVFCCHDYRAYQLMQTAHDLRLRIPDDIAVLGVDNDTTLCSFAPVPLSSIDPDARRLGYSAARMLNAMMERQPSNPSHRAFLSPTKGLVERESTEFIPLVPKWLSDALVFIGKNYSRGISASDVFKLSGRSATYVERIFRKHLSKSVHGYISKVRIDEAMRLLKTTDLMIKEIGERCGYSATPYFCRAFADHTGKNPSDVRRENREFHHRMRKANS